MPSKTQRKRALRKQEYIANKDTVLKQAQQYHVNNAVKQNSASKAYYEAHRSERLAASKAYYEAHRSERLAGFRRHYVSNKHKSSFAQVKHTLTKK